MTLTTDTQSGRNQAVAGDYAEIEGTKRTGPAQLRPLWVSVVKVIGI